MSASKYHLFYFNSRGLGEPARLVFAQAGVPYEDTRFKDRDDWLAQYKAKSPLGVAPWLEIDGKQIGGSQVVARFLGEELGLAGSNAIENAQIASIADHVRDFMMEGSKPLQTQDESEKAKLKKEFEEKCPKFLSVLEGKVSDSGWLFGSKLTWVDCYAMHFFSLLMEAGYPDLLKDYPKLSSLISKVQEQPNIAKWLKERPQTA